MTSDSRVSELKARVAVGTKRLVAFAVVGGCATFGVAFCFTFGAHILGAFYYPTLAASAAVAALCDLQLVASVLEIGRLQRELAGSAPETIGSRATHRAPRES